MIDFDILQVLEMAKSTLLHMTNTLLSRFQGLQVAFARYAVAILVQLSFTFTRLSLTVTCSWLR
jgi:hypothetical protein